MARVGRLLTWKRARVYALVLCALYIVAWADVIALGTPPLNSGGVPIAGDFIAFHTAGRLILTGHASQLYDHATVSALQVSVLDGAVANFYDAFRNPPFFGLLFVPFAVFDLLPAFVLYTLFGLACLGLSVWLLAREVDWVRARWRGLLVLVFAWPPVYFGLIDGENALLSLLLYVLIYRSFRRDQDVWLGVWSALGLFKPQLFIVFPLVLVVSRRWRALWAYVLVAFGLAVISLALVGADGLQAWVRILLEPEAGNSTANGWRMTSLKSFFDALVPGQSPVALVLYVSSSLVAVWALIRAWTSGNPAPLPTVFAFTSLVAVLVDPHLVDYDLTVLVCAAIVAAPLVRQLAWLVIPLYLVTLLRAQIPLGDVQIQLAGPLLAYSAYLVSRQALRHTEEASPHTACSPTNRLSVDANA
jgi:hypothetical protein